MKVRIYKPSKTAMQSGRAGYKGWVLEYETETPRTPEPLMGWTSSGDTLNQVCLEFETAEEAIGFADKKGWEYTLQRPRKRRIPPKNYGQNFKYRPTEKKDDVA